MLRFFVAGLATVAAMSVMQAVPAASVQYFNASQVATLVQTGVTSDTIRCSGYEFTYTRDKLFTGGTGQIIGRSVRVPWPTGVEAQAVTTPPPGITDYKARLTLRRADGDVFDLISFTLKLLANTGGAGANLEIMPLVDGEDAFDEPVFFNATGYYGGSFSYNETPSYLGSTSALKGFDTYKIGLYVDFAFTALVLDGAPLPGIAGDYNSDGLVDIADYTSWRDNLGAPAGTLPNDVDGDVIGQAQYDTWKSQFGASAGGVVMGTGSVPEPVSGPILCGIAALTLVVRRRLGRLER